MNKNPVFRVTLEPELEAMAGSWPAPKRYKAARKFKRWSRQLEVSANIMVFDARKSTKKFGVPALPLRRAKLN